MMPKPQNCADPFTMRVVARCHSVAAAVTPRLAAIVTSSASEFAFSVRIT
jgi:hypothetical protein